MVVVHGCRGYAFSMTFQTDAIYEGGVLRPLSPLALDEHQVVSISICTQSDLASGESKGGPVRDHSAFLNSYAPEDEGLYDDYSAG
jgi:predicted DNA-binding antitoxin AbrB/MazE fold protein